MDGHGLANHSVWLTKVLSLNQNVQPCLGHFLPGHLWIILFVENSLGLGLFLTLDT